MRTPAAAAVVPPTETPPLPPVAAGSSFTPGPWSHDGDGGICAQWRDNPEELIATAYGFENAKGEYADTPESAANANLIAAAPDMYAALLDCRLAFSAKNLKSQQFRALMAQAERKVKAAISKATGADR
jgi:hypothetical protein